MNPGWHLCATPRQAWKLPVLELMNRYALANSGSMIEDKGHSLAWHYRQCDAKTGRLAAARLASEIAATERADEVETVFGNKVVEARPRGVHKGLAVAAILGEHPDIRIIAIGDDRTDEDLFAAVPATGLALRVGAGETRARHRINGPPAVRRLLQALVRDA